MAWPSVSLGSRCWTPRRKSEELAHYEKVKSFVLLDREFSQEDREITPTSKIRRRVVEKTFAGEIEAMYIAAGV